LVIGKKPFHFAGMRGQQPFAFTTPEHRNFLRHDVQSIRVQYHGLLDFFNELEHLGRPRFAKPRTHSPDVNFLLQQLTIRRDWLYHCFHERRAGYDFIDFFGNKNFYQSSAGPERSL
jgi:hypothetical protein